MHTIEMCPVFPALFPAILSLAPSIPARAADASLFLTCFIFVFYLCAYRCFLWPKLLLENLLFLSLKAQLTPLTPLMPPGSVSSRLTLGPAQGSCLAPCRAPAFLPHLASLSLCPHCMGLVHSACPRLLQDISLIFVAVPDTQWVSVKPPSTQPA